LKNNKIIGKLLFDTYMIVTRRRAGLAQFTPCILGLVHLGCGRGHWPPSGGTDSACSNSGNHGGWILGRTELVEGPLFLSLLFIIFSIPLKETKKLALISAGLWRSA